MPPRVVGVAQSGRAYDLTLVRILAPGVALMSPGALVAKATRADDERITRTLLAETAAWAALPDSPHVLRFVDALLIPATSESYAVIIMLMPFCAEGALSYVRTRSPRSVLRIVAGVAAALQTVLTTGLPSHGNITMDHILMDSRGMPKLAGFGLTRALQPLRKETSDVRLIAEILYELIVGEKFCRSSENPLSDFAFPKYPPHVSYLLRMSLIPARGKKKLDLVHFRYELAAARGLLPICDSALPAKSPVPSKNLEFLSVDLNSVRAGRALSQPLRKPKADRLLPQPSVQVREASSSNVQPDTGALSPSTATGPVSLQKSHENALPALSTVPAINGSGPMGLMNGKLESEQAIRVLRVTDATATPYSLDDVGWLTQDLCSNVMSQQSLYKLLFKRPIGKKPIVALKSLALLHVLISDGPPNFSLLTVAHDGFLTWIETEWSKENVLGKNSLRELSECFENGDLSLYANFLRHRAAFQRDFGQAITPQWTVLSATIDAVLASRKSEMFRSMATMQGIIGNLIRSLALSSDAAAAVKAIVIPRLVVELSYACKCALLVGERLNVQEKGSAVQAYIDVLKETIGHTYESLQPVVERLERGEELLDAMKAVIVLGDPNFAEKLNLQGDKKTSKVVNGKKSKKNKKLGKAKSQPSSTSDPENETYGNRDCESYGVAVAESKVKQSDEDISIGDTQMLDNVTSSKGRGDDSSRRDQQRFAEQELRVAKGPKSAGKDKPSKKELAERRANDEEPSYTVRASSRAKTPSRHRQGKPLESEVADGSSESSSSVSDNEDRRVSRAEQNGKKSKSKLGRDSRKSAKVKSSRTVVPKRNRTGTADSDISDDDSMSSAYSDSEDDGSDDTAVRKKTTGRTYKSDDEGQSEAHSGSKHRRTQARKTRKSTENSNSVKDLRHKLNKPVPAKILNGGSGSRELHEARLSEQKQCLLEPVEEQRGSKAALAAAASGRKTPRMDSRFEIEPHEVRFGNQVGSGGFGVVFKGKFRGETVAIKKIHAHALNNSSSIAEFRSEVAVLCTLEHPNILRFLGACVKPPNLMIVTEFMARGTLFDLLHQSHTKVTWAMRKKMALDTCKGMRYLHDSKLLHRDLKSSNLMLDDHFNCKVGDFGLTRISSGAVAAQMTGQCGTFQYMAVEVLASKPYSEKADVFSFGVLLWELVARKLPYFGMQPMQVGIAVMHKGLRPTIPEKCPAPLARLVKACWHELPDRRPSFAQIQQVLEAMPDS